MHGLLTQVALCSVKDRGFAYTRAFCVRVCMYARLLLLCLYDFTILRFS